ncbi:MAG: AlkA N-terminal domain-containing protein [Deltaproteobacteria bacterium]|nr:AlkA N-terminal domain-containing protein [Deltaproteobacteria bacterium]
MNLDRATCYRAMRTRDRRFDGRFFIAVRTTGIYCRPVCPARPPKLENVTFYACAAAAETAGFRPCKRCRPETAPGTPAWLGSSALVARGLRLIDAGALDDEEGGVEALAARLGVGARQLRRLFEQHLGASPVAVARAQRLATARALIDQTALPMWEIAAAAGFRSLRQFNHAVRTSFGAAPTALRRRVARDARDAAGLTLRLPYRPPLDWRGLLAFLAARATPGVEQVADGAYRRTVDAGDAPAWIEVRAVPAAAALALRIHGADAAAVPGLIERARRVFDLSADPLAIAAHLRRDLRLRRSLTAQPGLRVPGAWDPFEIAVRAVVGQQVTVRGATTLMGRLVERCGAPLAGIDGLTHRFPTPAALAAADLTGIGMPSARVAALQGLAAAVARGAVVLDAARGLDEVVERLTALPGIGAWTAHYIAMRALGEPDAFPHGDLGLRAALGNGSGPVSSAALAEAAEAWRPWRAYAAMHLWQTLGASDQKDTKAPSGEQQ